jgi:hypothetical protein
MSLSDLFISRYHDPWSYSHIAYTTASNKPSYLTFDVEEGCQAYFRLHQDPIQECLPVDFTICKIHKNGELIDILANPSNEIDSNTKIGRRFLYHSKFAKPAELEKGEYLIRTKLKSDDNKKLRFTLSIYSSEKIE